MPVESLGESWIELWHMLLVIGCLDIIQPTHEALSQRANVMSPCECGRREPKNTVQNTWRIPTALETHVAAAAAQLHTSGAHVHVATPPTLSDRLHGDAAQRGGRGFRPGRGEGGNQTQGFRRARGVPRWQECSSMQVIKVEVPFQEER